LAVGAVDAVGLDPIAEITFLSTPVHALPQVAADVLAVTHPSRGVVTDVGSVKRSVVDAVASPRFVGGHPMAGSEQDGLHGAHAAMFEGATWVLTPTEGTDPDAFALVRSVVASLGADVVAVAPGLHDDLVALVSHVPHLAAAALMGLASDAATEHATLLRLAAGGFRDMTRIAAGDPGIWLDICAENRAAIVATPASTLHRLLGFQPGTRSRFRHDAANRLAANVVIVDECSMVSLSMMGCLLVAVRPSATNRLPVPASTS